MNEQQPQEPIAWATPITWDDFRDNGMFFLVNQQLHLFGLAITRVEPVLKWFYFLAFGGAIIALAVAGFRLGRLLTEDINKD